MSPPRRDPGRADQILDAALRAFARLGFGSARMDDVASESGLSKGALYLYFASKDTLIEALIARMVAFETRRLRDIAGSGGSAADRLLRFGDAFAAELVGLGPVAPMFPEAYARAMRHGRIRATFQAYLATFRTELGGLIREGIVAGEFRATDADEAALGMAGLLEGLALLWTLDPERVPIERASRAALGLQIDGLRLPGPVKGPASLTTPTAARP
ncbi:MAG: TetR/AcrR family transcriptional regulator [Candidatus Limnocylindrales bacterium]